MDIENQNSCRFKPVRLSFIFGTQMKIFLMKSESFLSLHWQLKDHKEIIKLIHMN